MAQPPFIAKRQRCRRGRLIKSASELAAVLGSQPSVWHCVRNRPVPSAFIVSQQFGFVIREIRNQRLYRVIRPPTPPELPI